MEALCDEMCIEVTAIQTGCDDVDRPWIELDWIEQGLTCHQTHYRAYREWETGDGDDIDVTCCDRPLQVHALANGKA